MADGAADSLTAALQASFVQAGFDHAPPCVGVALSGGGDSLALLLAAHTMLSASQTKLLAFTVDHGLRPASQSEAAYCAEICESLGLPHHILTVSGLEEGPGVMEAARTARYEALAEAGIARGVDLILVGHTKDDVAETFLMRLARGAGSEGLAAMAQVFRKEEALFARPFLGLRRAQLRDYLTALDLTWIEDPTNVDERFARTRARNALVTLDNLGMTVDRIAQSAEGLRAASVALRTQTSEIARKLFHPLPGGALGLSRAALTAYSGELAHRLLRQAIGWFSGTVMGLRRSEMEGFQRAALAGEAATLGGVWMVPGKEPDDLILFREPDAVQPPVVTTDLWDNRWAVEGPSRQGLTIGAVGEEGLKACPDWRAQGSDRRALLTTPAIWEGGQLVSAPLAGLSNGWSAQIVTSLDETLLSH